MKENTYKPQIPDMMEAIFDAAYLIFDLVAAILLFIYAKGNTLFVLYGILTLTLCGGDAFHLVPRIIRAVRGTSDKIKRQLGIGLQVSSITMTVFYIILMYVFPEYRCRIQFLLLLNLLCLFFHLHKTRNRCMQEKHQ